MPDDPGQPPEQRAVNTGIIGLGLPVAPTPTPADVGPPPAQRAVNVIGPAIGPDHGGPEPGLPWLGPE